MKFRHKPKTLAQLKHAKRRFLERTGLDVTEEDLNYIRGCIKRQQNSRFLFKQSNRISHWAVKFKETEIRVVYDKNTKNIVTVLPN